MYRLIGYHGYFTSLKYKKDNIIFLLIAFQLARRLIKMFREWILNGNLKKKFYLFRGKRDIFHKPIFYLLRIKI